MNVQWDATAYRRVLRCSAEHGSKRLLLKQVQTGYNGAGHQ
jgi:hypothetical protein